MKFVCMSEQFLHFPGGAETHMFKILKELQERGHEVSLYAHYEKLISSKEAGFPTSFLPVKDEFFDEELRKYFIENHRNSSFLDIFLYYLSCPFRIPEKLTTAFNRTAEITLRQILNEVIRIEKPDFFITHATWAEKFHKVLKTSGIPVLLVTHQGGIWNYDINLFNSEHSVCQRHIAPQCKDKDGNIKFKNENAIDMLLYPICKKEPLQTTREFDVGVLKLLPHKGGTMFWKLAKKMPDVKFLVVESAWHACDVKPKKLHEERFQNNGNNVTHEYEDLPDHITLIKPVKDIGKDFFGRIKVYLHPAHYEDFGMAPLEAQGYGIPVVSTDIMGLKETVGSNGIMIHHDRTKAVFEDSTIDGIEKALRMVLSDESLYNKLKSAGLMHNKEMYEKTMAQYDALEKVLQEVVNEKV